MEINDTSIEFFSLIVKEDGTTEKVKTGEIKNKITRGKHRTKVMAIWELISDLDDMNEASRILCENGLAVSRAEGRRLFTLLKDR